VRVERSRSRPGAEAPDLAQQLVFREHALGLLGEPNEELVLLLRELHAPAADGDDTGPAVVDERPLIERSGAFDVVHRDAHWTVYRLRDPAPLVVAADRTRPGQGGSPLAQGAEVTAMTHDTVTLDVSRPGRYVVKVTWSPYWRLVGGDGEVGRAPGDWVSLGARAPGTFVLQEHATLGAALRRAF